jgi:uncharacterized protein (TIGR02271 family)
MRSEESRGGGEFRRDAELRGNEVPRSGIVPLKELDDFKVAKGDPDVRGWDLIAADGTKVGEVEELLVDTAALKVRYLDVKLDKDLVNASDRHVLVPVGQARLDDDNDDVLVNIPASALATLPPYTREAFSRDYETSLRQRFAGAPIPAAREYYDHDHFDERRFFGTRRRGEAAYLTRSEEELAVGKRPVEAGEAAIRKTVETERVRQPVSKRREEVDIERRPVEGVAAGDVEVGEEEIRVPLTEEEVVVEKRPVVKEELVVKKRDVEETEQVEADLRKERIDVDERGRPGVRDEEERAR